MKRVYTLGITLTAVIIFSVITSMELSSRARPATHRDASSKGLIPLVIEDFEEAVVAASLEEDGWLVRTNPRPYNSEETEKKLRQRNPVPALELKMLEGSPRDLEVEPWSPTGLGLQKEKIMGVYFRFRYPGFNSIHFVPPKEVDWRTREPFLRPNAVGELNHERGLQLPGRPKALSIWVQGRGHDYNLEVWVTDHTGGVHVLHLGSINFIGWRPMIVNIPITVPIPPKALPQVNIIRLTELVLRSRTDSPYIREMISDTYVFFDQIKVLTDMYESFFEGLDLYKEFEVQSQDK